MTLSSSPSIVLPSRRTERALMALCARLHSVRRTLLARWRGYQAQRRGARAFDAIRGMDAHILRDIGAPDELISAAVAARGSSPWREVLFQLAAAAVAIAVIGSAAPTFAAEAAGQPATAKGYPVRPLAGVFTGEFVDRAPVYRFPAVVVTGSRNAKVAKSEPPVAERGRARASTPRAPT